MVANDNNTKLQKAGEILILLMRPHKIRLTYKGNLSCCCFDIEGEPFLHASLEDDNDEPASFHKALPSHNICERMAAMSDEMNLMEDQV